MLATELLFVYVYCLVDDSIKAGVLSIPRRPGPAPACTDARPSGATTMVRMAMAVSRFPEKSR